jgi:hypothetical protein
MLLIVFFHYITSGAFLISFQQYLKLSNFSFGLKITGPLLRMCLAVDLEKLASRQVCITVATNIYMHGLTNKYTS